MTREAKLPGLRGLKDFQLETVDYVFDRLYAPGASRRFLVADEVGLGKTMIAKGVVARAIEHLRDKVERIDVIYICSNSDIARQNINRLQVPGEHLAFASRLTLLPREVDRMRRTNAGVNFVSFTPATSFDVHGGLGQVDERVLLYALMRELWTLGSGYGAMNVFQGHVDKERFRALCSGFDLSAIDEERRTLDAFARALDAHDERARRDGRAILRDRFETLLGSYPRGDSRPGLDVSTERTRFVGELRALLAASCVAELEPDLIILDEFQRFTHLLDGADEGGQLAQRLFEFKDVAVLMLSATPYKMYTAASEALGENHYLDFVRTVRFLERDAGPTSDLDNLLLEYRDALMASEDADAEARLQRVRSALEERLRRVMVRTERLASTPDRNGMLVEHARNVQLKANDAQSYVALQKASRLLNQPDCLEFWKSAPYVLNFMDEAYKLKRSFDGALEDPAKKLALARALAAASDTVLDWSKVESYDHVEFGNARLRELLADTVGKGAHRLLWVPPSLPYYQPRGAFAEPGVRDFTKRLVFSAWRLVPRAVAACLSYEAERQMIGRSGAGMNTAEARAGKGRLLRFGRDDGRLTGMPVLALMYPSSFLARACDPARLAQRLAAGETFTTPSVEQVLEEAEANIEVALRRLPGEPVSDGPVDERWYWAAPLLLGGVPKFA